MQIKLDKTDSTVVKSNETYDVIDNTSLDKLIVSKTVLHPGKETSGHNHSGQEEVYIFTHGSGKMSVGEETFIVHGQDTGRKCSIILIPDGAFHKVWNTSPYKANDDLEFICVFDGGRNH